VRFVYFPVRLVVSFFESLKVFLEPLKDVSDFLLFICPFVALVYLSKFFSGLLLCPSFLCHLSRAHSSFSSYYTFTRRWKHWYQEVLEFLLGSFNLHFDTSHATSFPW
jgi:hypothetical protein